MQMLNSPTQADGIARILDRLYSAISFDEGDEPRWHELEQVFSRHARITRITPDGTDYMDPQQFLAMTRNLFELGVYTSFYEFEVARRVQRFGSMAHVWSLYETRRSRSATRALGRGANSIQLIEQDDGWRVLGLLWDETVATPELDLRDLLAQAPN
jgi:hypothetical protein